MPYVKALSKIIGSVLLLGALVLATLFLAISLLSAYDGRVPLDECAVFTSQVIRSYTVLAAVSALIWLAGRALIRRGVIGRALLASFLVIYIVCGVISLRYFNLANDGPGELGFWADHCQSYVGYEKTGLPL